MIPAKPAPDGTNAMALIGRSVRFVKMQVEKNEEIKQISVLVEGHWPAEYTVSSQSISDVTF